MGSGKLDWFAALATDGAATVVATTDSDGRATITRGWGLALCDDGRITVCVTAPPGSATRRNLVDNARIAVTVVDPATYASAQLKGDAGVARAPDTDDHSRVDEHVHRFAGRGCRPDDARP